MSGLSLKEPEAAATFAPVSIVPEGRGKPMPTPSLPPPAQPSSAAVPTSKRRSGAVEIRLAKGCRPDSGGNLVSGSPAKMSVARQAARSIGSARGRAIDVQPSTFLSTI